MKKKNESLTFLTSSPNFLTLKQQLLKIICYLFICSNKKKHLEVLLEENNYFFSWINVFPLLYLSHISYQIHLCLKSVVWMDVWITWQGMWPVNTHVKNELWGKIALKSFQILTINQTRCWHLLANMTYLFKMRLYS